MSKVRSFDLILDVARGISFISTHCIFKKKGIIHPSLLKVDFACNDTLQNSSAKTVEQRGTQRQRQSNSLEVEAVMKAGKTS